MTLLKRSFFSFTLFAFSSISSACPLAAPTQDPSFCSSFKQAAECHCSASGLPNRMCKDMNVVYDRMIAVFRSVQKACEFQHDTSTQECVDGWNCYRYGGVNSKNELCSATGLSCA